MNRQSVIFIGVGLLVLFGLGYFLFMPGPKEETVKQNQLVNAEKPIQSEQTEQPKPLGHVEVEGVFKYTLNGYEPQSLRVEQGQQVILRIISEVADEAHLHGYDLSKPLVASEEITINFVADKTGRFELELEKLGKPLGTIEVYPK